jgi:tRNA1Val (adenine37-N6)-methyltransferase
LPNPYFQFKQFLIRQDLCAMKVTTDACLFGAWIAERWKAQMPAASRLLDIGTGTGLLSLMIRQKNPAIDIDAIEVDQAAAQQAMENFADTPWEKSLHIINADVKTYQWINKYDCIVSNPPFYENALKSADAKRNLAHHSRELSLSDLVEIIAGRLRENGKLFLLLPFSRRDEAVDLLKQHQLYVQRILDVRQSHKHGYFRVMLQAGFGNRGNPETRELSIWDGNKQYTAEFASLLKEYYLYL